MKKYIYNLYDLINYYKENKMNFEVPIIGINVDFVLDEKDGNIILEVDSNIERLSFFEGRRNNFIHNDTKTLSNERDILDNKIQNAERAELYAYKYNENVQGIWNI